MKKFILKLLKAVDLEKYQNLEKEIIYYNKQYNNMLDEINNKYKYWNKIIIDLILNYNDIKTYSNENVIAVEEKYNVSNINPNARIQVFNINYDMPLEKILIVFAKCGYEFNLINYNISMYYKSYRIKSLKQLKKLLEE